MTSKLTLLLLVLSLIGISKPVKAFEEVAIFALPFLGALVFNTNKPEFDYDKRIKQNTEFFKNLNYIPVGGCKVFSKRSPDQGTTTGRACKQADGSWKVE